MTTAPTPDPVPLSRSDLNAHLLLHVLVLGVAGSSLMQLLSSWLPSEPLAMALTFFGMWVAAFPAFRLWKISRGRPRPKSFARHAFDCAWLAALLFAAYWSLERMGWVQW